MSTIIVILSLVTLVLLLLYYLSTRKFDYWKKKKIVYVEPIPLFGNYKQHILLEKYYPLITQEFCQLYPDEPYIGTFFGTEPTLILQDLELIKLVTTKDFYYFNSREIAKYTSKEVTTGNIFFSYGDRWKIMRQNLNPFFSSANLKKMFPLIEECAHTFDILLDEISKETNDIEVRELMARYTIDCVSSCSFGVNSCTMVGDYKNNEFWSIAESLFAKSSCMGLKYIGRTVWPAVFYGLGFKLYPLETEEFFYKMLTRIFKNRDYKPSPRHDMIDLVLNLANKKCITAESIANLKTGGNEVVSLAVNDELLVGQCVVFFAAGFETSATTLAWTLFELAKNKTVQEKAIAEVDDYLSRHDGKLGYHCISELPYLEACVDETMRIYPVLGVLTREVIEKYTFPTGLTLDEGVRVHIPVYHIHHNPKYFPEPEIFRPERFVNANIIQPNTYFPFGAGHRTCMGSRLAKIMMLSGLVSILSKHTIELGDGMPLQVGFEPKNFVLRPNASIRLKFLPRDVKRIKI